MTDDDPKAIGQAARNLVRGAVVGSLATVMRDAEGAPYASLVSVATDAAGAPILLISDLADHTKNLKQDARVSLLVAGNLDREDPLSGERLSLQGTLARDDDPHLRKRYLARHPGAAMYADFGDFGFYRMTVERGHLVAGFGRIHWIEGEALTIPPADALIEDEAGIVEHMNEDHADALELYATRLLSEINGSWRMTGVDCEGIDLRLDARVARLAFGCRIENGTDVRKELIRLVNKAREA